MNSTFVDSKKEVVSEYLPDDPDMPDGLFICPLMFLLSFVFLADKWKIPNQLLAMIYGSLIGTLYYFVPFLQVGFLYFWKPDKILVLCHPIMIVKVAYTIDNYVFCKSKWQILIIATIGTGIFIFLFGYVMMVMANRDIILSNIVAAGTTLAAIDVPEVLNELNRIKNLEVIMDGESIFGAALCIMSYNFAIGFYDYTITTWYHVVCLYSRFILLGFFFGWAMGWATSGLFRFFYRDSFNASVTVLSVPYFTYFIADSYIYCSATIATFFASYMLGRQRVRLAIKIDKKVQSMVNHVYACVEFIACIALSTQVTYGMLSFYKGFDFAVAVGVYIMGNVLRILIFLMLSPLLSRMGLGFNITALLTISWAAKRGSLQLLQVIYVSHYGVTGILGTELLCFTVVYLALSFVINMTSLRYILRYFGLIEFTMSRKFNISLSINCLMERKQRIMFTLKTNRRLSELNWELIHRATLLNNPYAAVNENSRLSSEFETVCPECKRTIPYLRSREVQEDMIKITKIKLLNHQRVALVRQFELNVLGKTELEIILQFIEFAVSSPDVKLSYAYFLDLFDVESKLMTWTLKLIEKKKNYAPITWRPGLYKWLGFIKEPWYIYLKVSIMIAETILIITWTFMFFTGKPEASIVLYCGYGLLIFYLIDILLKVITFTWPTIIVLYSNILCALELVWILVDIGSFSLSILFGFHYLRIICLLRIIFSEYPILLFHHILRNTQNREIEKKWAYAYRLGVAIVLSLEEMQVHLHTICKIESVRSFLYGQVQRDKILMMDKLVMVQMRCPKVAVTVSTTRLKMALLKLICATALEIKNAGLLELCEYRVIRKSVQTVMKNVRPSKNMQLNSSHTVLKEIIWVGPDPPLLEYLYSNIMLRVWEKGDIICNPGEFIDGVIVITKGALKMSYVPNETILENLYKFGMLPIVEQIRSTFFEEPHEEYLVMGTTLGELSFLTKRPYDCKIEAIQSTTALIITEAVLIQAKEFNTNPISGLTCRMWKSVASGMLWPMLAKNTYQNNTPTSSLHTVVNQAFIPDIDHYKVVKVSSVIDEMFLIDGIITDVRNMEHYIAPCYIPRTVHQFEVHNNKTNVKTKIMVLPRHMVHPQNAMQSTEEMSETNNDPSSTALLRNVLLRQGKREAALNATMGEVHISTTSDQEEHAEDIEFEPTLRYIVSYMTRKNFNFNF